MKTVNVLFISFIFTFSFSADLQADQRQQCLKKQEKLREIQAKLRQGYSEPTGNKLRKQRRKLQEQLNTKKCRRYLR
jgi:hypothetical protein